MTLEEKLLRTRLITESGCWEWTGKSKVRGYGRIQVNKKKRRVHRVAYELWIGPIPVGHGVLHSCDNPPCFNPEHLFTGTQLTNIQDSTSKGRGNRVVLKGANHGNAKLSVDEVLSIRALYTSGRSKRSLGREFGVSDTQIRKIVNRIFWTEI